jgi:NADPH:quinone reductase-like Zn-dependent oxidoreductase
MKQWVTKQDGLDKLRLVEVPEPSDLKEGEVLVKIHCVSLNFRDTEGKYMGFYLSFYTERTQRNKFISA